MHIYGGEYLFWTCLYIHISVYSGIYLFLYFFTRTYSSASSYPPVHLSIMLPAYRSTSISVCLSIYLSTYLLFFLPISVCMSECFHIYQCLYFVHQCIYTGIFGANVHLYIYPQSIFTLKYCSCEFGCMTTTVYLHTKLCSCESIHVYVHSHIDPVNLSIPTARPMPESHDCFHFIDKPIRSPANSSPETHRQRRISLFAASLLSLCVRISPSSSGRQYTGVI